MWRRAAEEIATEALDIDVPESAAISSAAGGHILIAGDDRCARAALQ